MARIGADRVHQAGNLVRLAFEQLEPEAYAIITGRLATIRSSEGGQVDAIALKMKQRLAEAGLKVEVYGREKHPFSIWHKMAERHVSFEQVTDIMAFRVLTESEGDCYQALGILHTTWQFLPGRFKDYISTPKSNGYRSLHTSLMYENSMRVEVQIRTRDMHRTNEFGLAAHWAYKQGDKPDGQVGWLRDLIEIVDASHDAEELLEHTRMAIYQDRIFAFTPKGALFQLPKGATAVDFAFAVHTNLGLQTAGVKINGRHMPLRTPLANGDVCEIIKNPHASPQLSWLSFVVTGKARARIRSASRTSRRRGSSIARLPEVVEQPPCFDAYVEFPLYLVAPRACETLLARCVGEQFNNCIAKQLRVAGLYQPAVQSIFDQFGDAGDRGADDWKATGHRFHQDIGNAVRAALSRHDAGHHQQRGCRHVAFDRGLGKGACQLDLPVEAECGSLPE